MLKIVLDFQLKINYIELFNKEMAMKLEEFVKFMREDLEMFIDEYKDAHQAKPQTYPAEQHSKEWLKQFKLYAGL